MVEQHSDNEPQLHEPALSRFYDRLRQAAVGWACDRGGLLGESLMDVILLTPDVFMLLWRLFRNKAIPRRSRTAIAAALTYFLLPVDVLPDWALGPLGFADDLIIAYGVLQAILVHTPIQLLEQEWSGPDSLIVVLARTAKLADRFAHLPGLGKVKRMLRFLLG